MTIEEARQFFRLAHAWWPPTSLFRFFSRHPNGQVFGCAIHSPEQLLRAAEWAGITGYSAYWQPNPTRKTYGTRCSTRDITHWQFFLIDLDPPDTPSREEMVRAAQTVRLIFFDGLLPVLQVYSGRGVQLLYPFEPLPLSQIVTVAGGRQLTIREAAPLAMSHHLRLLAQQHPMVDPSCSDLPRPMRLPFTTNPKTGNQADIIQAPPLGTVHPTLGLDLIAAVPEGVWQPREPLPLSSKSCWMEYLPAMSVTGRRFLQEGHSRGGRHKAATAAMLSLIELGANAQQVRDALHFGAALCDPTLPPRDVEEMVGRRFSLTPRRTA